MAPTVNKENIENAFDNLHLKENVSASCKNRPFRSTWALCLNGIFSLCPYISWLLGVFSNERFYQRISGACHGA